MEPDADKELVEFLHHPELHSLTIADRLIAILWWHRQHGSDLVRFAQIQSESDSAGYSKINATREKARLKRDKRTTSQNGGEAFRLAPSAIPELDNKFSELIWVKNIPKSDSVFEQDAFKKTRGYIEKVVQQINVSYDYGLYDCCAVMIRRLLETLIIEAYETQSRADELKGKDGNFMMLSGLLIILEKDKKCNIGRQSMDGLKSFKKIADSSAHNRRFNASQKDISDKLDGVQMAVAELRQIAFNK